MGITELSGKMMRWRLRHSEFDYLIQYEKSNINAQADALSQLAPPGERTASQSEDIPSHPQGWDPHKCLV